MQLVFLIVKHAQMLRIVPSVMTKCSGTTLQKSAPVASPTAMLAQRPQTVPPAPSVSSGMTLLKLAPDVPRVA